jgi:hypothetical protein
MSEFYHSSPFGVLQDIALFEKPLLDNKDYPAKIEEIKIL